jgi:hypothetical protein
VPPRRGQEAFLGGGDAGGSKRPCLVVGCHLLRVFRLNVTRKASPFAKELGPGDEDVNRRLRLTGDGSGQVERVLLAQMGVGLDGLEDAGDDPGGPVLGGLRCGGKRGGRPGCGRDVGII